MLAHKYTHSLISVLFMSQCNARHTLLDHHRNRTVVETQAQLLKPYDTLHYAITHSLQMCLL